MTDIRDMSQTVEAVKIAMTQDKNGHVLKLSLHPNDTPEDLLRDPVGTRYTVVFVRVNDEGEPVRGQQDEEGAKAVTSAVMLCKDNDFQWFLVRKDLAPEPTEDDAISGLKEHLGITSRKELRTNSTARRRFFDLRREFTDEFRAR